MVLKSSQDILECKGVGVRFAGNGVFKTLLPPAIKRYRHIGLSGVDLTLKRGDKVAVVGASGSGKTALLRAISEGYVGAENARIDGRFSLNDNSVSQKDLERNMTVVGVFHPKWTTAKDKMIGDIERLARAHNDPSYKGEDPLVVALDEPTLNLAPAEVDYISGLIQQIAQKSAVVMVVHNLGFALQNCDHIVHLDGGKVAFSDRADLIKEGDEALPKSTKAFFKERLRMQGYNALGERPKHKAPAVPRSELIQLANDANDVFMGVRDGAVVFNPNSPKKRVVGVSDVSFDISKGETVAFMGPSGSGKTTALKIFNLMHESSGAKVTGEARFNGVDLLDPSNDPVKIRSMFGYVAQKAWPFEHLNMVNDVTYPAVIAGIIPNDKDARIALAEELFKKVGLYETVVPNGRYLTQSAKSLSGGEQQRFCLARALSTNPQMLLMDEPCSALDPIATVQIEELIEEFRLAGISSVVVTHSLQQAARISQKVGYFHSGSLLEMGDTSRIMLNPQHPLTLDFVSGRIG